MYPTTDAASAGSGFDPRVGQLERARMNAPTPTNGRVQIPQLLDEQNGSLIELHKTIAEFEQRLAGVLAPDVPTQTDIRKNDVAAVQVVDRLLVSNRGIAEATGRLRDLIQRLHL